MGPRSLERGSGSVLSESPGRRGASPSDQAQRAADDNTAQLSALPPCPFVQLNRTVRTLPDLSLLDLNDSCDAVFKREPRTTRE
jgi:hypothetical protein